MGNKTVGEPASRVTAIWRLYNTLVAGFLSCIGWSIITSIPSWLVVLSWKPTAVEWSFEFMDFITVKVRGTSGLGHDLPVLRSDYFGF